MSFSAGSHDDEDIKILEVAAARQKETTYVIFVGFGYYFLVGSFLRLQNCWPLTPFASTYYFWANRPPRSGQSVINKSNGWLVFFLVWNPPRVCFRTSEM